MRFPPPLVHSLRFGIKANFFTYEGIWVCAQGQECALRTAENGIRTVLCAHVLRFRAILHGREQKGI